MKGTFEYDMLALHEKYGDIVRVAPDELAASHPDAWRDIMARRPGSEELVKSSHFYRAVPNTPTSILNAEREEHTALRRQLNHGFSEKSMREQEPLIKQYIDLLIQRLNENCGGGSKTVDLAAWYNFTTFDIIGDLTFGEPFNCLQDSNYHPFVSLILSSARAGVVFMSVGFFPLLKKILLAAMSRSKIKEFGEVQRELSIAKLRRRTQVQQRYDLIEGLLQKKNELVSYQLMRRSSLYSKLTCKPEYQLGKPRSNLQHHRYRWLGDNGHALGRGYLSAYDPPSNNGETGRGSPWDVQERG